MITRPSPGAVRLALAAPRDGRARLACEHEGGDPDSPSGSPHFGGFTLVSVAWSRS